MVKKSTFNAEAPPRKARLRNRKTFTTDSQENRRKLAKPRPHPARGLETHTPSAPKGRSEEPTRHRHAPPFEMRAPQSAGRKSSLQRHFSIIFPKMVVHFQTGPTPWSVLLHLDSPEIR